MKQIIYLMIFLMTISIVAASPLYYKPQGTAFNFSVPCEINGADCSIDSTCYLTNIDPNSMLLINYSQMSNMNNGFHTFLLNSSQTQTLGEYTTKVSCIDGIYNGTTSFRYMITDSNMNFGSSEKLDSRVLLIFGLITLVFITLYIFKSNIVLGYASATMMLLLVVVIWTQGINLPTTISLGGVDVPAYYSVPLWITGAFGFIMVLVALWLFYHASRDEPTPEAEKDYREEY